MKIAFAQIEVAFTVRRRSICIRQTNFFRSQPLLFCIIKNRNTSYWLCIESTGQVSHYKFQKLIASVSKESILKTRMLSGSSFP